MSCCHTCKSPTIKKCSQCKVTFYCDKKCQLEDWSNHKEKCIAFKTHILDLNETKCIVIALTDNVQRKLLHQCIEVGSTTFARSLKLDHLPSGKRTRFLKKCYNCDRKYIRFGPNEYHKGIMDNNMDEYYSVECPECHEDIIWECNFDGYDFVRTTFENNCLVVGNAIKSFKHPNRSKCMNPELPNVESYQSITFHDVPKKTMGLKCLMKLLQN